MYQPFMDHMPQLVESGVCLLAYLVLRRSSRLIVRRAVRRSSYKASEEKGILRLLDLLFVGLLAVTLTAIWGMEQSEILVFATSVITVLGVAFFAEMSILSNITACVVLFFQHPVKIGDHIRVQLDDQELEGELVDITYFFVFIRTAAGGTVSVPNAALLKGPFTILHRPTT